MKRLALACLLAAWSLPLPASGAPEELQRLQADIHAQGLQWEAGETEVSRLSPEQRARLRMPRGMPPPLWNHFAFTHPLRPSRPPQLAAPLPPSVDWRARKGFNFLPAVRDQGACGACWAFGTVGTIEGTISIRRSKANPTIDLSEQNLLDCAAASLGCDSGGLTWGPAETYMKGTGVTTETCYPYTSGSTATRGVCTTQAGTCATTTKVEGSEEILATAPISWPPWDPPPFVISDSAMDEIKTWLQDRPVGTSMRAYDDLSYYKSGVYEPSANPGSSGLHAVVIVGYDDVGGYWIVRNSWKDTWGDKGYFRIKYKTSSLGMYSFVYNYDEAHKDPAFCPDLPKTLDLTGTSPVDLKIANCGSGILDWQAQLNGAWLKLADATGAAAAAGSVVSDGTTYKVSSTQNLPAGASGTITLTGAPNGPVTIAVSLKAMPPDASAPGPDAAPPGKDAAPPGPDAAPPGPDAAAVRPDAAQAAPDGGSSPKDAGQAELADAGPIADDGGGCGCRSSGGATLVLLGLLSLAAARRRRQRVEGR